MSVIKPDVNKATLLEGMETQLQLLRADAQRRDNIKKATVSQSNCPVWTEKKKKLLTASHFGHVCKRKASTSCASMVKKIVYATKMEYNDAIMWGIDHE